MKIYVHISFLLNLIFFNYMCRSVENLKASKDLLLLQYQNDGNLI